MINVREQIDKQFYIGGFNCAETTLSILIESNVIKADKDIVRMMTGFGGGMAKGYVCGSVVAAISALGLLYGRTSPEQSREISKDAVNEYLDKFLQVYKTIQCDELIGSLDKKTEQQYGFCKNIIETSIEAVLSTISSRSHPDEIYSNL